MNLTLTKREVDLDAAYREESIRGPLLLAVVVLVLIAAPLLWLVKAINEEGAERSKVEKYTVLVEVVKSNLQEVNERLAEDGGLDVASALPKDDVVTLVMPEIVLVDEASPEPEENRPLDVTLDAIYWSPASPIVGINGETYHLGDLVQGHEIIQIGKTEVHFKSRSGQIVVKDFYEDLLRSQN